jgi:hypothetical protein
MTGEAESPEKQVATRVEKVFCGKGLVYSQFNELLLLLGYDRVSASFFQLLVDGSTEYKSGAAFKSIENPFARESIASGS